MDKLQTKRTIQMGTNGKIIKRMHNIGGDQQIHCKANAQYEYLGGE